MENLKQITSQTSLLSSDPPTISQENTAMTADEEQELFTIINQVRALHGWSIIAADELEPICKTWWKELARYKIPRQHYQTLYERALDARVRAINIGSKNLPEIDAIALIAGWTGEYGLASELRQKEIDAKKFLPATAVSDCDLCFGTGWETVAEKGARRCTHGRSESYVNPHTGRGFGEFGQ